MREETKDMLLCFSLSFNVTIVAWISILALFGRL
jgi:hypothetical protein